MNLFVSKQAGDRGADTKIGYGSELRFCRTKIAYMYADSAKKVFSCITCIRIHRQTDLIIIDLTVLEFYHINCK